ncbi:MAG TPA: hypothetical protein VGV89_10630 [Thermoplasmata archaeon]|nr:hypothetical protein [Thermoplasmata archaeon]
MRPLLGADAARLTRTVNDAIVHGDLAPLLALSSADRRMLLELLDRRSSRFRTLPECRSLVRLTELLLPPLAVDGRLAAPGVPAR